MPTRDHERTLDAIRPLAVEFAKSTEAVLGRVRDARGELARVHEPLIAFVHIPKTAGATATDMLAAAYSRAAIHDAGNYLKDPERTAVKVRRMIARWDDSRSPPGRVTAGHVPYGLFREYLPATTRYITLLREPVDRVVSHYYGHVRRTGTTRDEWRLERGLVLTDSIEEALVELRMPVLTNLATRFLCGNHSPMGELPASALDDAKSNLREFAFVGLQERFEQSMVLLQRMLGLDPIPYLTRHMSIERPGVEEIPAEQRALIAEHNQLDAELYAFAQGLLDEAVAAADEGLAADAERLGVVSQEATDEALGRAREWLDQELPLGSAKPKTALMAAAEAAGVSPPALKHLAKTSVDRELRDEEVIWVRIKSAPGQQLAEDPHEGRRMVVTGEDGVSRAVPS